MNGWVELPTAAAAARRPMRTLRTWVRRSQVTSACRLDGKVYVWWPDVYDRTLRSEYRATRRRSRGDLPDRLAS